MCWLHGQSQVNSVVPLRQSKPPAAQQPIYHRPLESCFIEIKSKIGAILILASLDDEQILHQPVSQLHFTITVYNKPDFIHIRFELT